MNINEILWRRIADSCPTNSCCNKKSFRCSTSADTDGIPRGHPLCVQEHTDLGDPDDSQQVWCRVANIALEQLIWQFLGHLLLWRMDNEESKNSITSERRQVSLKQTLNADDNEEPLREGFPSTASQDRVGSTEPAVVRHGSSIRTAEKKRDTQPPLRIFQRQQERIEKERRRKAALEERYRSYISSFRTELPLSPTGPSLTFHSISLSRGLRHLSQLPSLLLPQWERLYPSALRAMATEDRFSIDARRAAAAHSPEGVSFPFSLSYCPFPPAPEAVETLCEMSDYITRSAHEFVSFLPYFPSALTPALLDGWTSAGLPMHRHDSPDVHLSTSSLSAFNEDETILTGREGGNADPLRSSAENTVNVPYPDDTNRITHNTDALASRAMRTWFPSSETNSSSEVRDRMDKRTDGIEKCVEEDLGFELFAIAIDDTVVEVLGTLLFQKVLLYSSADETPGNNIPAESIWKWLLAQTHGHSTRQSDDKSIYSQDTSSTDTEDEEVSVSSSPSSSSSSLFSSDTESSAEPEEEDDEREGWNATGSSSDATPAVVNDFVYQLLPAHYRSEEGIAERMIHFTLQFEALMQQRASVAIPFYLPRGRLSPNQTAEALPNEEIDTDERGDLGRKRRALDNTQGKEKTKAFRPTCSTFQSACLPPPSTDVVRAVMKSRSLTTLLHRLLCEKVFPRLVNVMLPLAALKFTRQVSPILLVEAGGVEEVHHEKPESILSRVRYSPLRRWYRYLWPLNYYYHRDRTDDAHSHSRTNDTMVSWQPRTSPDLNMTEGEIPMFPDFGMEEVTEAVHNAWKKRRLEAVQSLSPPASVPFSNSSSALLKEMTRKACREGERTDEVTVPMHRVDEEGGAKTTVDIASTPSSFWPFPPLLDSRRVERSLLKNEEHESQNNHHNNNHNCNNNDNSNTVTTSNQENAASASLPGSAGMTSTSSPASPVSSPVHKGRRKNRSDIDNAHDVSGNENDSSRVHPDRETINPPQELFLSFHADSEIPRREKGNISSKAKERGISKEEALAFWSFVRGMSGATRNQVTSHKDDTLNESREGKVKTERSRSPTPPKHSSLLMPSSSPEDVKEIKSSAIFCCLAEQKLLELCQRFTRSSSVSTPKASKGKRVKRTTKGGDKPIRNNSDERMNGCAVNKTEKTSSHQLEGRRKKVEWLKLSASKFMRSPNETREEGEMETSSSNNRVKNPRGDDGGEHLVTTVNENGTLSKGKAHFMMSVPSNREGEPIGRRALPLPFLNIGMNSVSLKPAATPSFLTAWNSQVEEVKGSFCDVIPPPPTSTLDGKTAGQRVNRFHSEGNHRNQEPDRPSSVSVNASDTAESFLQKPFESDEASPISGPSPSSAWDEIGTVLSCVSSVLDARTLVDESGWRYGRNRVSLAGTTYIGHAGPPSSSSAPVTSPPHALPSKIVLPFSVSSGTPGSDPLQQVSGVSALPESAVVSSSLPISSSPSPPCVLPNPFSATSLGEQVTVEGMFFHEPGLLYTANGETYAMETYVISEEEP